MQSRKRMTLIGLALMILWLSCHRAKVPNKEEAVKDLKEQVASMLPTIRSLTGIQQGGAVEVNALTKAELGRFFQSTMDIEYPDGALKKRGECFAEIGLLPRGYDMRDGFVELLSEQAGGIYNQHDKTLIGIVDLPPERKRAVNDRMIFAHELTHALQDRVIDIVRQSEMGLKNIDYEYSVRALMEGMASGIMVAYAQNLTFDRLPDLQSFWRSQLSQAAGSGLGRSPHYLREYLMSPYAEGGRFIQAWLKANPDKTMNDLLKKIPSSSEQVLHFEKYVEGDEPSNVDFSGIRKVLPKDWKLFYANTLGEFDLLTLFQLRPETREAASELAAGWDGCQFEAYRDAKEGLILVGRSVWDGENDAKEFCEGIRRVLGEVRASSDYDVAQSKACVNFIIGSSDRNLRAAVLKSLSKIT